MHHRATSLSDHLEVGQPITIHQVLVNVEHLREQDVWQRRHDKRPSDLRNFGALARQSENRAHAHQDEGHGHKDDQVLEVRLVNILSAQLQLLESVGLRNVRGERRVKPEENHDPQTL